MAELPYYDDPRYWSGELNRQEPFAVVPYQDFPIHAVKAVCIRHIFDQITQAAPRQLLDAGCARGYLVRWLRRFGIEAWGADISSLALSQAPASVKPYLTQADLASLPYPDKTFDLVITTGVLEHFPDEKLEQVLAELARVARYGYMAITLKDDPGAAEDRHHPMLLTRDQWQARMPAGFIARSDANEFWMGAYNTLP